MIAKEEIENYITELESMFELSELEEHSRNILKVGNYIKQLQQENQELKDRIDKAIEYIEKDTRWFDSEYASIYGTLCTCAGAKDNRLEVMVNPSNLLEILKGDKK